MDEEKINRVTELTKRYLARQMTLAEQEELAELQKEWLLEQTPSDLNIKRIFK